MVYGIRHRTLPFGLSTGRELLSEENCRSTGKGHALWKLGVLGSGEGQESETLGRGLSLRRRTHE